MKSLRNALLLLSFLSGLCVFGQTVTVSPDSPAIRYVGRFTDDFRFGWTGCMIETEFNGTEISAIIDLVQGKAAVTAVVDGKETVLFITAGQRMYPVASGLVPGQKHHVVLFKRSEGVLGTIRFGGFDISADGTLSCPPARERKILALGDSITCGYGNEAATVEEGNTVSNENGYMSYAAIAARALDADLMMVCWSGRGLYRNLSPVNDKVDTMPQLFEQTLPQDKNPIWDMNRFVPDVIAINLGTNDTGERGGKEPLKREDYEDAYVKLINRLREFAPDAKMIISIGPMASASPVKTWLPGIAERFKDVSVVIYPAYTGPDEYAGHGHPNIKKDQMMAARLEAQIRKVTGWQ